MAINPAMLAMALRAAPMLMGALQQAMASKKGTTTNIEDALNRGYDSGNMENDFKLAKSQYGNDFDALRQLNNQIGGGFNLDQGMASDGVSQLDLENLADRMIGKGGNNVGGSPAALAGATFINDAREQSARAYAQHLGEMAQNFDLDEDARMAYVAKLAQLGIK